MTPLIVECETVLNQLETVLNKIAPADYCRPSSRLGGSSIGQHMRHVLEFFVCLGQGVETGVVNYDKRARDPRIENNPEFALAAIHQIRMLIQNKDDQTMQLQVEYQNSNDFLLPTTYAREIAYNIEHATHHMAIIKIGIGEVARDLELPAEFGLAPSTVRHKKQSALPVI